MAQLVNLALSPQSSAQPLARLNAIPVQQQKSKGGLPGQSMPKLKAPVSPTQARQAAIAELPRAALGIPGWKEAKVSSGDPIVFYDLKETLKIGLSVTCLPLPFTGNMLAI